MNGDHEHIPMCDECDPQLVAPLGWIESFCAACGAPRWRCETPDPWPNLSDVFALWGRNVRTATEGVFGDDGRRIAIWIVDSSINYVTDGYPMYQNDMAVRRNEQGDMEIGEWSLGDAEAGSMWLNPELWEQTVNTLMDRAAKRRRRAQS